MTDTKLEHLSRRKFLPATALAGGAAMASSVHLPMLEVAERQANTTATIHRFTQTVAFPVNAYIVEGNSGVVVIDSTLTVTDSKALRAKDDELGKPLRARLLSGHEGDNQ
jgi:hypothetical protein